MDLLLDFTWWTLPPSLLPFYGSTRPGFGALGVLLISSLSTSPVAVSLSGRWVGGSSLDLKRSG